MKTSLAPLKTLLASVVAILSVAVVPAANAQDAAGANAKKYSIAVVDISKIFKEHQQFRAQMEGMKGEVQGIEKQLEGERQKIITKEQEKNRFKAGSAEFSRIDDELATMKAQLQLNMQRMRKGFLEKEAQVYYSTYQQVNKSISDYARYNNIAIVFRYSSDPADPAQRESVLRVINKPVQYQAQIDITNDILALVNRNAPAARQATGQAPPRR